MKLLLFIIYTFLFLINVSFADQHKTKFKDIKGYKKQFLSMSYKKTNRIIEVKKIDGFPVYDGETSIQVITINAIIFSLVSFFSLIMIINNIRKL